MLKLISSAAIATILLGQAARAEPLGRFDVAEDHTRFVFAPPRCTTTVCPPTATPS